MGKDTRGMETFKALGDKALSICERKDLDYVADTAPMDLWNFVLMAAKNGTTVRMVFDILESKHQNRIEVLDRPGGVTPQFESIEDSLIDKVNYTLLRAAFMRVYPHLYNIVMGTTVWIPETGQTLYQYNESKGETNGG